MAIGLALVPVHAAAVLCMPSLLGGALDQISAGGTADALATTCWILLGLAAVEAGARFTARKLLIDASREVERSLKDELARHLQRVPIAWFDRSRTGDITARMTQDVELVRFVMGPLLLHGGSTLFLLPAGAWLMVTMNVPVALTSLGVLSSVLLAMRALLPRLHGWSKRSQEAIAAISQRAQEDFAGVRVIQQFAITDRQRAAMATRNRRFLLANLRLVRLRSLMNALTHSSSGLVMLSVLTVGGHQVITGHLTVGQLFQFTGYLGLMTFPLQILGWTIAMIPRALAGAQRIEELFAVAPEPRDGAQPELRGAIEVRGLTFTYPGSDRPALRDVSFSLPAGGRLGLVGPVGSGKSTLIGLLLRFYDPPRGTVFVDGRDVLDLAPDVLRRLFALAPQEPFLFSDTIGNNVAFHAADLLERDASKGARDLAIAAAALDQDLPRLPGGLDTVVGERGVTLSGGQKQRVSLARALLSDRPALLLDDTLSAVDANTERRILDGLGQARRARTMITVSHRLSVVRDADLILILRAGHVVERGDHHTLLRSNGAYALAWRRQHEAQALAGEEPDDHGEAR